MAKAMLAFIVCLLHLVVTGLYNFLAVTPLCGAIDSSLRERRFFSRT
jgi:hypothetical protein